MHPTAFTADRQRVGVQHRMLRTHVCRFACDINPLTACTTGLELGHVAHAIACVTWHVSAWGAPYNWAQDKPQLTVTLLRSCHHNTFFYNFITSTPHNIYIILTLSPSHIHSICFMHADGTQHSCPLPYAAAHHHT